MYVLRFACTVYACYVAFPFVNICVFIRVLCFECYIPPCLILFSVCVMLSIPCWVWRVRYLSSGPHGVKKEKGSGLVLYLLVRLRVK